MSSIIPSYIYSLFATIIVGTLIVTTCAVATVNMKEEAEKQQLSNIADYVATNSMELLASPPADNLTLKMTLDVPPLIGNQQYWIQIQNDSSHTWVETGFGTTILSSDQQANIPSLVEATGFYVSDLGTCFLEYQSNKTGCYLILYGGN